VKTTTEGESGNGITGLINQAGVRTGALDVTNADSLLESDVTAGATHRLFGIPVTVTNKLPAGKAVLADMSQVAIRSRTA